MDRRDIAALQKCLSLYKKQSTRAASEVAEFELRHSWKRAALYACQKMQAQALGLNAFQLTPSELSPSSPLIVSGGDTSRRAEMIALVRQLDALGPSQFEADPRAAIAAEFSRREKALFLESVSAKVGAFSADAIGLGSLHRIARDVQLDLLKHSGPFAIGSGGTKGLGKYGRAHAMRR